MKAFIRLILFPILPLLLLNGCDGEDLLKKDPIPNSRIQQINVPAREHGYSNFDSLFISSQNGYELFVDNVKQQEHWNNKEQFLLTIQLLSIDFREHDLVIFRAAETSGSIRVEPQIPNDDGNVIHIEIERTVPNIGTANIANYGFFYLVEKAVDSVKITYKSQDFYFPTPSDLSLFPGDCSSWFDGCNNCTGEGALAVCTLRACLENIDAAYCTDQQQ